MNGNQPLASTSPYTIDNDDHSRSLNDLQNQDIHALVSTFVQSNAGQPLIGVVVPLLDTIAAKATADLQCLINQLLSTLTDRLLYNRLFNALKAHIEAHPWSTVFLIIGIVLLCNPLAMAGFKSLGPVAGKSMHFVFHLPFLRNHWLEIDVFKVHWLLHGNQAWEALLLWGVRLQSFRVGE
jgi:hypothetical protein